MNQFYEFKTTKGVFDPKQKKSKQPRFVKTGSLSELRIGACVKFSYCNSMPLGEISEYYKLNRPSISHNWELARDKNGYTKAYWKRSYQWSAVMPYCILGIEEQDLFGEFQFVQFEVMLIHNQETKGIKSTNSELDFYPHTLITLKTHLGVMYYLNQITDNRMCLYPRKGTTEQLYLRTSTLKARSF